MNHLCKWTTYADRTRVRNSSDGRRNHALEINLVTSVSEQGCNEIDFAHRVPVGDIAHRRHPRTLLICLTMNLVDMVYKRSRSVGTIAHDV
jgi:hypothetical protein